MLRHRNSRNRTTRLTQQLNHYVVLLTLSITSLNAFALDSDRDQPIYVAADRASIDDNTGITVYTGDVDITQGSMILKGDRVELYRDAEGNVDRIQSFGKPAYFEQQPSPDQAVTIATGNTLNYAVNSQLLEITGSAKVEQAGDEFTGARINYDMEKALVDAFSDTASDKRVRMVIQPRSESGS